MTDASSALTRQYGPGTTLFEEHEPGSRMYVIREGRVKIFRRSGDNEMVLAILGPGDFFGEMALLENLPRSANAQTIENTKLIEVDAQTFGQMLRSSPEIAMRMMRRLAARVRELDLRLHNLLVDNGVGRSIEILRWLLGKGRAEGGYVRLDAHVVHIGIAAQAGIPPHEVQMVYERLRDAGCIQEDGKDVLVANNETLDAFSNYLDLKRRFDPTHVMSPAGAASERDKNLAMQRLLKALQIDRSDLDSHEAAMSGEYSRFVELRRRFELGKGADG
jgi:CRP-like cAMP-binding protein